MADCKECGNDISIVSHKSYCSDYRNRNDKQYTDYAVLRESHRELLEEFKRYYDLSELKYPHLRKRTLDVIARAEELQGDKG